MVRTLCDSLLQLHDTLSENLQCRKKKAAKGKILFQCQPRFLRGREHQSIAKDCLKILVKVEMAQEVKECALREVV